MIKATDIYAVSHDGLDIILYYYPQAEGCVDNKKKLSAGRMKMMHPPASRSTRNVTRSLTLGTRVPL